jgi:hypothetical protein
LERKKLEKILEKERKLKEEAEQKARVEEEKLKKMPSIVKFFKQKNENGENTVN